LLRPALEQQPELLLLLVVLLLLLLLLPMIVRWISRPWRLWQQ
jgi:hypothetical protein